MFKKQKKTSWFPAPKKSNKAKKGAWIGLGVGTVGAVIAGLMKKPAK